VVPGTEVKGNPADPDALMAFARSVSSLYLQRPPLRTQTIPRPRAMPARTGAAPVEG
jgi:hypothetical protein